jgi:hypothetical protein
MPGTSGPTSPVPLAFYDPASRSLKTLQGTFLEHPARGAAVRSVVRGKRMEVEVPPG